MTSKYLSIANEMRAVDTKNRAFYDNIPSEETKHFTAYVMMKWASDVDADPGVQEYYLRSTNINANINLWDINKHPKLQWLSLSAISPNMGTLRHSWISAKKKEKVPARIAKAKALLAQMHPEYKLEDINLLATLITKEELKEINRAYGNAK